MKINEKFFPVVLIVLQILAAAGYVPSGTWHMVAYWLAATVITYIVTYYF